MTMASVKTAISLDRSLFEQVEVAARSLKVSRSRIFALAVGDFLRRRRNQEILDAINSAYQDFPDEQERELLEAMHRERRRRATRKW